MKLGIITDEVSQNLTEVGKFVREFGLSAVEIRSVNNRSPFDYTDADIEELLKFREEYGVEITSIASPLFKCDFYDDKEIAKEEEQFEILCKRANILGATVIRAFDFLKCDADNYARAEKMSGAIKKAKKYGIKIGIETENSANSYDANTLSEFLSAVGDDTVGAVYDPGNEVFSNGFIDPDGYEKLKPFLLEVHIKDAVLIDGKPEAVKIGTGLLECIGLIKKLKRDEFSGTMMLETHYRLNASLSAELLHRPGGDAFSLGAYEASEESMKVLKGMVE